MQNKIIQYSLILCLSLVAFNTLAACPPGTEVSKFNEWFCCKDGWAYTKEMKKYDYFSPYCGCPNGGTFTPPKERIDGPECCKNNFAYNASMGKYSNLSPRKCGCPDGGVPSESDKFVCCKNNYAYDEKLQKYNRIYAEACGCPDGGEERPLRMGTVCCKNGFRLSGSGKYDELEIMACGCPNGMIQKGNFCCNNGFVYREDEERYVQPHICGCPEGGQLIGGECVKDGYTWDYATHKYDLPDAHYGCPKRTEKKGDVCCKNGFVFNSKTEKFDKIDARCGCPYGSTRSNWGPMLLELKSPELVNGIQSLCCKNGKAANLEGKFEEDIVFCKPVPKDKTKAAEILYGFMMKLFSSK